MSNLTASEKTKLEKLFEMSSGYVLDFSNSSFSTYVFDSTSIRIYEEYDGSKANLLRAFWNEKSNYLVAKLLKDLLEHYLTKHNFEPPKKALYNECLKIVERLEESEKSINIKPNSDEKDFHKLSKSIKESMEKNEPELALDRLHTFCVKYIKELCNKHSLVFSKDEPLHSLFGKYVKYLISNKLLESKMSEKILKTSISLLDEFNDIRNNKSLAHDNSLLNYNESLLIFNNISNIINFLERIEK